jgi:predicted YcjX-like family ATPase
MRPATITRLLRQAGGRVEARLNEHVVRLAVTGLSRAGKTVFITSLLQNLLALGAGQDTLPAFAKALARESGTRLRSVRLVPPGAARVPWFDLRARLAQLAAEPPSWPTPTDDIAQISLVLELDRPFRLLGTRRIRLEILDYPGEWLLDLPMLEQSFAVWSRAMLTRLAPLPQAAEFLAFAATVRASEPADETRVRRGHALYRAALEAARGDLGLRFLQPGRFLTQGRRDELPFMWFFPLALDASPPPGSLGALLRDRFDAYRADMRAQVFDPFFRDFNRQVVLVDVLGALSAGRGAYADTEAALAAIAAGLARRRLKRVVFAATKADHVPALRRDNLRHLLEALTRTAGRAAHRGHVIAAVLSTTDGAPQMLDGRAVETVTGVLLGEDRARPVFVGDVPSAQPPESFWNRPHFALPVFRPPRIDPGGTQGIPHLGLDTLLVDLLGDLL